MLYVFSDARASVQLAIFDDIRNEVSTGEYNGILRRHPDKVN